MGLIAAQLSNGGFEKIDSKLGVVSAFTAVVLDEEVVVESTSICGGRHGQLAASQLDKAIIGTRWIVVNITLSNQQRVQSIHVCLDIRLHIVVIDVRQAGVASANVATVGQRTGSAMAFISQVH